MVPKNAPPPLASLSNRTPVATSTDVADVPGRYADGPLAGPATPTPPGVPLRVNRFAAPTRLQGPPVSADPSPEATVRLKESLATTAGAAGPATVMLTG